MRRLVTRICKKMKKKVKIALICSKYALMREMAYPVSFLMGILIDVGYEITFIALFIFLYREIDLVAGWSYYEMLLLLGIDMIVSEIMVGTVFVSNISKIPNKIKDGSLDMYLIKPLSSLYYLSVSDLYPMPLFNALLVLVFIGYVLYKLFSAGVVLSIVNIAGATWICICGVVVMYCLCTTIVALSFYFPENKTFSIIAQNIPFEFTNRPHTIFKGFFKYVFFVFIPVVYASSIPAFSVVNGVNLSYLLGATVLAVIFYIMMVLFWNMSIKKYSSATS